MKKPKILQVNKPAPIAERYINVIQGLNGEDGKQGDAGEQGAQGIEGRSITGDVGRQGPAGPQGPKGDRGDSIKGAPGEEGAEGLGIARINIINGNLIITYTDGSQIDLGPIIGPRGQAGLQGRSGSVFTGSGTGFPWYNIPSGTAVEVPINRQHLISGEMNIEGEFVVKGEAVTI